jgi:hypothetical protein
MFINADRLVSGLDGMARLELETQGGDVIVIEATTITIGQADQMQARKS